MKKLAFGLMFLAACSKAATPAVEAKDAAAEAAEVAQDVTAVDAADVVSPADAPSAVTP